MGQGGKEIRRSHAVRADETQLCEEKLGRAGVTEENLPAFIQKYDLVEELLKSC